MKNPFNRLFRKKAATNEFKDNEYARKRAQILREIDFYQFTLNNYDWLMKVHNVQEFSTVKDLDICNSCIDSLNQDLLLLEAKHQLEIA